MSSSSSSIRTLITIVMDVLVIAAVVITAAVIIAFFGVLSGQTWGKALLALAKPFAIPFPGLKNITTPYGGVFRVDLSVTVVVLLLVEWGLSLARRQA